MIPLQVEGGRETYHPEAGLARQYWVGGTTWWAYRTYVPCLGQWLWSLYGHSRTTGYVGRGTHRLVGTEGVRVLREAREIQGAHGPDIWYAPCLGLLVTGVKDLHR